MRGLFMLYSKFQTKDLRIRHILTFFQPIGIVISLNFEFGSVPNFNIAKKPNSFFLITITKRLKSLKVTSQISDGYWSLH